MCKQLRKTKIIITLGPTTDNNDNLEKIISLGTNVVRLNFSHGNTEEHFLRAKKVREIANKLKKHIAILGDLQGPKIRITAFKNEKIFLNHGDLFILDSSIHYKNGNQKQVGINYKKLSQDVNLGDILLLDDGKIRLQVIEIKNMQIYTQVIVGGCLSNNKGINKLGGGLSINTLTKKDKTDIITAAKIGVDYLAISFPRNSKDINYVRKLSIQAGNYAKIIAKIERAEIVSSNKNIDDIILASDVVMIARGDLSIEIGNQKLIKIQKTIIQRARTLNKVVITATQMMESMINNSIPTRAEIMDVANAVLDGTDAVMLSAETAIGKFPKETVAAMDDICIGAEKLNQNSVYMNISKIKYNKEKAIIAIAAIHAANQLQNIKAIISLTNEAKEIALIMSRIGSRSPIFVFSKNKNTLNIISLYRGIIPIYFNKSKKKLTNTISAINLLRKKNFIKYGNLVAIIQNDPLTLLKNSNNILRILKV